MACIPESRNGDKKSIAEGAKFYESDLVVRSYDLLTQQANPQISKDAQFYIDMARRFATDGGRILELGVGTGRVAIAFANAGFSVVGVDASGGMLDVLRAKLKEPQHSGVAKKIEVVLADITKLEVVLDQGSASDREEVQLEQFPLAVMPFSLLAHLPTQKLQRDSLAAVRRHLPVGAHLVLDVFDPVLDACIPGAPSPNPDRQATDPANGEIYKRYSIERVNTPLTQSFTEKFRVERWDPSGETLLESVDSTHHFRWVTRGEMRLLFELTGFAVESEFGGFEQNDPEYAKRQVWILKAI